MYSVESRLSQGLNMSFVRKSYVTRRIFTHRCYIIHLPSCLHRRLGKNIYSAMMPYMNYVFSLAIIELCHFAPYVCLRAFSHYTGSVLRYYSSQLMINIGKSMCLSCKTFAETRTVKQIMLMLSELSQIRLSYQGKVHLTFL